GYHQSAVGHLSPFIHECRTYYLNSRITINNRKDRLHITELGKKVIDRANAWDENLEYNLSLISRSYRNICVSRQLDSELE
ncbi:hypothetical protein, partial [Aeromonas caviae]